MDTDKKKKQRPYTEYERQLLMQLVQSKIDIVENRRTDGTTHKKKYQAWEDITRQFNNSTNLSQTASAAQLKKMWQNLKAKARDAKTLEQQKKWTGGGPALPEMGAEETQVLSIVPTVLPTINVEIDSDIQPSTSQQSQGDDDDSLFWQPKRARTMGIEVEVIGEEPPSTDLLQGSSTSQQFPAVKKNKCSSVPRDKSLEELKKELVRKEIEKVEQQIIQQQAKHEVELEILKIKRDQMIKEINNK